MTLSIDLIWKAFAPMVLELLIERVGMSDRERVYSSFG